MRFDERYPTIPVMVRHSAERFGDRSYLLDEDQEWSFAEAELRMVEAARAFVALGIAPRDRVVILGPNSAGWIHAALGIYAAGGIVVPVNTRFKGHEIAHVLERSGASAIVTVGGFLGVDYVGMIREAAPESPALSKVVILDDVPVPGTIAFTDFLAAGAGVPEGVIADRISGIGYEDASDIIFTSGTTGAPKGVPLRHGTTLRSYHFLLGAFTITEADTHAIVPPFFHTFGSKTGWLGGLITGARIIPLRTFDSATLMETIERHRVSVICGPPTVFIDMIADPRRPDFDLSSLRAAVPGSAGAPVTLVHDMHDVLGFEVVLNAYGLTEAHSIVATCLPSDPPEIIAGTVGRAIDDVEVVIADDDGLPVANGTPGEILVRGYTVMDGYWDDPAATARAIDADGFLHTGDVGTVDDQGYLRVTDRKKDMFIVGGFNAYPAEIESVLMRHDGIQHVAVIGVPDERMGEVGWAYVVPAPGSGIDEQEVIAYARGNLANYKVPRRVVLVDELPRNATSKVLKFVLRERAAELRRAESDAARS